MTTIEKLTRELSLRKPQQYSLTKLDTILSNIQLGNESLQEIEAKLIGNLTFDTAFPSFSFALATGVGKTRLMGAMIAYLYETKGLKDFFILTPGETIYTKTIENFTIGADKYVLDGLSDFPQFNLITGDNYTYANFNNQLFEAINIYVFNIQKIFNERKDVEFKFHKFQETLGSSFAELLQQKRLVMLLDESHRYRGVKSLGAINHLNPVLGLEFTATPNTNNVVYNYSLADAINDSNSALEALERGEEPETGYIKIPKVVTRKDNFAYTGDIERLKLEDGILLHQDKKTLLEEYCTNHKVPMMLPITLITTKSIDHAHEVEKMVQADNFFEGYYKDKTLVVTSESETEAIEQLLHLEAPPPINKKEIVIHVDKLKEGWDVRNVFTIIPFRASISKTLIEQTIGRGLRLPFGKLLGIEELDSLDVISHDNFARVVAVAHEVAAGISVKEAEKRAKEKLVPITITPSEDKKLWIKIPVIQTKIDASNHLDYFPAIMRLDELKTIHPTLIRADIVGQNTSEIDILGEAQEISPVNRIVRLILITMTEFEPNQHKRVLQSIVEYYLSQIKVDKADLGKIVKMYEQTILDDLVPQLRQKLQEQTKITHHLSKEELVYEPFVKSMKASEATPLDRNEVNEQESRGSILSGYTRTVYPLNFFDSAQEKYLADSLEQDKTVKAWLRLRLGQLPINYIYGSYNPDFVVELADGYYLVEVKDRSKIDKKDPEVFAKAKQAVEWCKRATEATKKPWQYKLIPHTAINRINSLDAIISNAVKVED